TAARAHPVRGEPYGRRAGGPGALRHGPRRPLTPGAVVAGPVHPGPAADRGAAAAAGQSFAAVGVQGAVEVAGFPVDVDVQAVEAGAAHRESGVHDVPDVSEEDEGARPGEGRGGAFVVDAGPPQRLVRVDVADPADQ